METLEKLIDIHFEGQKDIILSKEIVEKRYKIIYSEILNDEYWNLAFIKDNCDNLKEIWQKIKVKMNDLNRIPILYLLSNADNEKQLIDFNLENIYTDVWLVLDNLNEFKNYESTINVNFEKVTEDEKSEYIQAIMDGFSSTDPKDPYGVLPEEYRKTYEIEFEHRGKKYKTIEYCGKSDGKMISTANAWYKDDCAIVYTVSTNKEYQKKGVCKSMMSYIVRDLKNIGIKTICVQTEQGFYTEQVYKKIGFREVMLGKAYAEK